MWGVALDVMVAVVVQGRWICDGVQADHGLGGERDDILVDWVDCVVMGCCYVGGR